MSKKDQLLQEAEWRVRSGGYNNVSFRDLAEAVGIKSASVHYHFPTKADLGEALAERYTDDFLQALGTPEDIVAKGMNPIAQYKNKFRSALLKDKKMCLCGLLGAELDGLPDKVKTATKRFFELNLEWLIAAYKAKDGATDKKAHQSAAKLLARLEGALIIARTLEQPEIFEEIVGK